MKKKIFSFGYPKDVSNRDLKFNNFFNLNIKDRIRDLYDLLLRRTYYRSYYKKFFKKQKYKINLVLPAKGFSDLARKKKLNSIKNIKGSKILNLGCGNGIDIISWVRFKPSYIKAIDLMNYSKSWNKVKKYLKKKNIKTTVSFQQKNIININQKDKYDFIVSDAVFEHLNQFDKCMRICSKLLKKNGVIYASYGPLWYNYGGDHFSGRDKYMNGFNHIILDKKKYLNYFNKNFRSIKNEIKFHGSGGLFVIRNLFSKLRGQDYMNVFKKYNLKAKFLAVEFCPLGYELIKNKEIKNKILLKNKNINIEDCYLKSHIIYLQKK
tara:strand:+ start:828 stop:1793 length:966 start_codon:yes stop_codon:yes gene_type:complete